MTQEVPLASFNSTFHHVCTLVKHSVCSLLFLHIILWGCSVSGVLWLPLFPLHAFLFRPAQKLEGFLLCPTFDCKTNAHDRCPVSWHLCVFCFLFLFNPHGSHFSPCGIRFPAFKQRSSSILFYMSVPGSKVVTSHPAGRSWVVTGISLTLSVAWELL